MIVIYQSNTGYTEQYAKMLARRLDVPAYPLEKVPKCHLHKEAVFLGWLFAGNIVGYKKAAKNYCLRAVCGVGMSPPTAELADGLRVKMHVPSAVPVFYLQGGFDINKLHGPMKLIMKFKCKEIAGRLELRGELSEAEQAAYQMTQTGGSAVSEAALAEVLAYLR